ncbi:MAG: hypothetical protein GY757_05550, partial [bacterium]|nr:hypothetical protein [bacterium]
MAKSKLNFFDYIKAAFHQKVNITGLGHIPVNKILLGGAAILGIGSPGIWFLALAVETAYLWFMASNENYHKVVQAEQMDVKKDLWAEKQKRLLRGLDARSRERYDLLVHSCSGILNIADSDPLDSEEDMRISGLNRLLWMFLKLLDSLIRISSIVKRTSKKKLEATLQEVSEKIAKEPENSALRRSYQGTIDIQKRRLENYLKAEQSKKVIESELERIEMQVTLLTEEASVSSDPELLSVRLDGVMDSLTGTNQWMSEQSAIFGFIEEDSMPDELISKPNKPELFE